MLCGTNVNVGKDGGVLRYLELNVGRPLQRMICLFHFNELPFRHLFEFYFGKTTGPRIFGGEFGKKITQDLTKLTIVDYSPISGCNIEHLSEQVICELSNDQKYLYNIAKAIENDPKCFPTYFVDLNPGTIHHARWLTRANRVLRLYVSTLNPSFEFLRIVSYIMNVDIPFWFYFKQHPYCFQGTSNLFHSISLMRTHLNNN